MRKKAWKSPCRSNRGLTAAGFPRPSLTPWGPGGPLITGRPRSILEEEHQIRTWTFGLARDAFFPRQRRSPLPPRLDALAGLHPRIGPGGPRRGRCHGKSVRRNRARPIPMKRANRNPVGAGGPGASKGNRQGPLVRASARLAATKWVGLQAAGDAGWGGQRGFPCTYRAGHLWTRPQGQVPCFREIKNGRLRARLGTPANQTTRQVRPR